MPEDTIEWPKRPVIKARTAREISPPKTKPRLEAGRGITRRRLLKAGLAAAAVGLFGRGAGETAIDIKEGVEKTTRAFKQLSRFFNNELGAVQGDRISETSSIMVKPRTEFSAVFHNLSESESQQAVRLVRQMHGVIAANSEYQNGSLYEVTKKHETEIKKAARFAGIESNLAIGIVFVENGGGEAIRNANSGALGVAQLMPETAKRYGLQVGDGIDERKDPKRSLEVLGKYLKDLKLEFLDSGLAVWGYHAGEGNVYSALRAYFRNVDRQDFGDVIISQDPAIANIYRRLISERKLTVHHVLQNPQVQAEVLSKLGDETELYVYKVIAASQLYRINKENFG